MSMISIKDVSLLKRTNGNGLDVTNLHVESPQLTILYKLNDLFNEWYKSKIFKIKSEGRIYFVEDKQELYDEPFQCRLRRNILFCDFDFWIESKSVVFTGKFSENSYDTDDSNEMISKLEEEFHLKVLEYDKKTTIRSGISPFDSKGTITEKITHTNLLICRGFELYEFNVKQDDQKTLLNKEREVIYKHSISK